MKKPTTPIKQPFEKIKVLIMNQGIRFRLGLFFLLVSLLPLLALGFFSYYKSSSTIKEVTTRYSSEIINEIYNNLMLKFDNINNIGKVLLNSNTVKEILSRRGSDADSYFSQDNDKMELLLETIRDSNENIRSTYILSHMNDNIFAVGDITEERGLVFLNEQYRRNYKSSALYQETIDSESNYIWWPTQYVLGNPVFILSEKLRDHDDTVLGVLVIHVGVEIMDEIYNSIKTNHNSLMYLMDGSGRILFHPDKNIIGQHFVNKDIIETIQMSQEGSFIHKEKGKEMFVVFNTFPVTQWKFIVVTAYNQLISDSVRIRDMTLLISAACIFFILLASLVLTRSMAKPLYKLMELMEKGARGDIKVRFNVRYNDEIGQLGNSFNMMMANIEQLIQLAETESRQRVEAEIKSMEAHINPHFLYNTLASIYWSAMAKGNHEIGKMAASLSRFFKLGLNKGKEYTTVKKEVEHVKEYLTIQKMLYKNLFDYEINVDQEILNHKTIKLILQPLAENSIVHGFGNMTGDGFIRVDVFRRDDLIVFRVTDNGAGIKGFGQKSTDDIIGCGYGLKNIRERLRLYFNNDYTIECSSSDTETTFEVTIPAIKEAEKYVQAPDNR